MEYVQGWAVTYTCNVTNTNNDVLDYIFFNDFFKIWQFYNNETFHDKKYTCSLLVYLKQATVDTQNAFPCINNPLRSLERINNTFGDLIFFKLPPFISVRCNISNVGS